MSKIAMPHDVSRLVGDFAEGIQNRSLLLEKYAFHKSWPVVIGDRGPIKWDNAPRWSFMRLAKDASTILLKESENRRLLLRESEMAKALSRSSPESSGIGKLRVSHTKRFLNLFRSAHGEDASVTIGSLEGRLAINLADGLIQNAGICLDRLFGLPYIPGSAVKGVCRHTALEKVADSQGEERVALFNKFLSVFGSSENDFGNNGELRVFSELLEGRSMDQKGAVDFLPAWPINETNIVVDLTNVHYPKYYSSGREGDLANEQPRPNPFPAVEAGAKFAFCILLNGIDRDQEILRTAKDWLKSAITERGLGAKTSAGYGWFSIDSAALDELIQEEQEALESAAKAENAKLAKEQAAKEEADRKASLSPEDRAMEELLASNDEEFAKATAEIANLEETKQRVLIHLLRSNKDKKAKWKMWKKRNKTQFSAVQEVITKLNEKPLP